jgi:hypothetical protein
VAVEERHLSLSSFLSIIRLKSTDWEKMRTGEGVTDSSPETIILNVLCIDDPVQGAIESAEE